MIEVEKRVIITSGQFDQLLAKFKQEAKFIKDFKRCTLVNIEHSNFVPDSNNPIDIRVRSTVDSCQLTVKHGDWKNDSGRAEYEVNFAHNQIIDMLQILFLFGCKYYVMTYLHRYQFEVGEFVVTIDKYANSNKNLLEVELMVETKADSSAAELKINKYLEGLNLISATPDEFLEFVQEMNNVKESQIDFTAQTPQKYFEKLEKYIKCEV